MLDAQIPDQITDQITNGSESAADPKGFRQVLSKTYVNGEIQDHEVGVVKVDIPNKRINFELYQDPCRSMTAKPQEIICLAMPKKIENVTIPLTRIHSHCGSTIYLGDRPQRSVWSPRIEIEVYDHSHRQCGDPVKAMMVVRIRVTDESQNKASSPAIELPKNYLLLK